ncbi:MAG: type II secretory protein PulK [Verrucomicrobiota bacterium]
MLVLVTIMLAGFMLVKFIEESSLELTLATRAADQRHLRADAYSALETTLAVIAQIRAVDDEKLQSPEQGWADPYGYAGIEPREGVEVAISFEDESGKLSLPRADFRRLQVLFETLGLSVYDSERVADAFKSWTDAEYTPINWESAPDAYKRETPAHQPANRSLRSFEEIRAITVARDFFYTPEGEPTPLAQAFRESVSLYDFPDTNINAAPEVLLTANTLDLVQVANLRGYVDGSLGRPPGRPAYFRTTREVQELVGGNAPLDGFGVDMHLLRIIVHVREGASTLRLVALVAVDPAVTFPEALPSPSGNGSAINAPNEASGAAPAAAEERLDYPFQILEIHEDHAPRAELP